MLSSNAPVAGAAALVLACAGGCVSVQAVEPVIAPPEKFRFDTIAQVEFVAPALVGLRCAERGAKFMGIPAFNSGACADANLITMIDPCLTLTAGPYARSLCANIGEMGTLASTAVGPVSGAPSLSTAALPSAPGRERFQNSTQARVRTVEFVSASSISAWCLARGASPGADAIMSCSASDLIALANPCDRYAQGWYERTLCHELAHVNGWAPDHAGGEPRTALRLASESPQALAFVAVVKGTAGVRR